MNAQERAIITKAYLDSRELARLSADSEYLRTRHASEACRLEEVMQALNIPVPDRIQMTDANQTQTIADAIASNNALFEAWCDNEERVTSVIAREVYFYLVRDHCTGPRG